MCPPSSLSVRGARLRYRPEPPLVKPRPAARVVPLLFRDAVSGGSDAPGFDDLARVRGAPERRHARPAPRHRESHGRARGGGLVPAAPGGQRRRRAARDPAPQPRRGKRARGHGARVDPPSRSGLGRQAAGVPVHRGADRRARAGGGARRARRRAGQRARRHRQRGLAARRSLMMKYPRRHTAPLSDRVWKPLDEAIVQAARHVLAGRRIATFAGPRGWDHVATRLGTMTPCRSAEGQAVVCVPDVVLMLEVRVDFSVPWASVENFERGAPVLDTGPAETAARELALAEDRVAFYGDPAGSGFLIAPKSPRVSTHDWTRPGQVLADLVKAVETLDADGIPGPYEAVLPTARYYSYLQAVDDSGYPTARQLRDVLGAVHRSPAIREAR